MQPLPSRPSGLEIRALKIRNYKRLDELTVAFPSPRMANDADVTVLGSKNGGGKTSVLECLALLVLSAAVGDKMFLRAMDPEGFFVDLPDLLITSGATKTEVSGTFSIAGQRDEVTLQITRAGRRSLVTVKGGSSLKEHIQARARPDWFENSLASVLAFSGEPLVAPPLLYFNSYRKVQEGNPDLAVMSEHRPARERWHSMSARGRTAASPVSAVKMEMLRSLLGRANLFEGFDKRDSDEIFNFFNTLLKRYTGGTIDKLRPLPDNTLDFRVTLPNGTSFAFDGLSAGQKEIVSTLFLIWRHSHSDPILVLIDEPELHLNAEWHADFVEQLQVAGPMNQYILATHSEQVFRSVANDHRILLECDP